MPHATLQDYSSDRGAFKVRYGEIRWLGLGKRDEASETRTTRAHVRPSIKRRTPTHEHQQGYSCRKDLTIHVTYLGNL